VPAGSTLALEGAEFGEKQGRVVLQVGAISLPAKVEKWDGKSATATLPIVGLGEATTAHVHVFTADAKLASSVAIQLVPMVEADAKAGDAKTAEASASDTQKTTETAKQAGPQAEQAQVASSN
jgi:hypothetical protein